MKILSDQKKREDDYELMMSLMQLETLLAESEVEVMDDELEIIHNGETYRIFEHNERLVKVEGYQILMNHVEDVHFYFDDEELIMSFSRNEKEYEYEIYKKEWWRD